MQRREQTLQKQVAFFLDHACPLVWWHCPNGGARSGVEGAILKSMGVKAGVPDLTFILPNGTCGFIELKGPKGRLSEAQEAFRDRVMMSGCLFEEARSLLDVAAILEQWLEPFGVRLSAKVAA